MRGFVMKVGCKTQRKVPAYPLSFGDGGQQKPRCLRNHSDMSITIEHIRAALRGAQDPNTGLDLGVSVKDRDIQLQGGRVALTLELGYPPTPSRIRCAASPSRRWPPPARPTPRSL